MKKVLKETLRVLAPAVVVLLVLAGIVLAQTPNGIRGAFSGTVIVRAPFRLDMNGHLNASGTNGADTAGTVTLSSGSQTLTFAAAFKNAPACVGTDQTAAAAVKIVPTTTGLTFTGTGSDVIAYHCFANKD